MKPQSIDPTIPSIEILDAIPSLDGDRSKTVYRYRITLPGLEPCLIEERQEDSGQQFQSWLRSAQEQHPECFRHPDAVEYLRKHGKYLQVLRERIEEIRCMVLSGSLFD